MKDQLVKDLEAARDALKRVVESPELSIGERKSIGGSVWNVERLLRVHRDPAPASSPAEPRDWRMDQTPTGDR